MTDRRTADSLREALIAVDETVILLHPPLPLVGVSIVMDRESVSKMTVSSMATGAAAVPAADDRADA